MYDTVFLSDVHLGTAQCNTDKLLPFLTGLETRKLVLVGDIVDIYSMQKYGQRWNREHTACARAILDMAGRGVEIVYILGNHEQDFRSYIGFTHDNISVVHEYVHVDSTGRKYLCLHGDEYSRFSSGSWKQLLFMKGYEYVSPLNRLFKSLFNFSLVNYLKNLPDARRFIAKYENDIYLHAYQQCRYDEVYDGVICGHIHHPAIRIMDDNFLYACCGDWVDSCTALLEKNGIYCIEKY